MSDGGRLVEVACIDIATSAAASSCGSNIVPKRCPWAIRTAIGFTRC